ncbi:MAG: hypothetical protein Q8L35_05710 [Actinomycetota bacterium]|nr:hypothetical protein [Actinomycetota bacterium]
MRDKARRKDMGGKASPGRLAIQVVTAILAWGVFAYLWFLTFAYKITSYRPYFELAGVALTAAAIVAITQIWVWHNLRIWRRKGARKKIPEATFDFSRDWLGRRVEAQWDELKKDSFIKIMIEGDKKIYKPYRGERYKPGRVA